MIYFNEPLDDTTIAAAVTITPSPGGAPSATLTAPTRITFDPGEGLEDGTAYTVTVSAAVKDLSGNPLAADHVFTFTTWEALTGFAKGEGCGPAGRTSAPGAGLALALMLLALLALAAGALRRRSLG